MPPYNIFIPMAQVLRVIFHAFVVLLIFFPPIWKASFQNKDV